MQLADCDSLAACSEQARGCIGLVLRCVNGHHVNTSQEVAEAATSCDHILLSFCLPGGIPLPQKEGPRQLEAQMVAAAQSADDAAERDNAMTGYGCQDARLVKSPAQHAARQRAPGGGGGGPPALRAGIARAARKVAPQRRRLSRDRRS